MAYKEWLTDRATQTTDPFIERREVYDRFETLIAGVVGGGGDADYSFLAGDPDSLLFGTITRDTDGAATASNVLWPDGDTGVYTSLAVSATFPGAVDSYQITKVGTGVGTGTYTQPSVTRDAITGAVTVRPAITFA